MQFKKKSQNAAEKSISNKRYRVAMVVFSIYPTDNRIRRAAQALSEAGMGIDVYCLKDKGEPAREWFENIDVHRMKLNHRRLGVGRYLFEYAAFLAATTLLLGWRAITRGYDLVYVHNIPDILVFSAFFNKLSGAKVVLDLHDPMPELFQTIFGIPDTHPIIRLLAFFEKLSIGFADAAVTTNIAFRNLFIQRSCRPEKMHIVMNTPMERLFSNASIRCRQAHPAPKRDAFNLMYHGTIVHRHGLDIAIRAVRLASERIPNLRFHVYGEGDFEKDAAKLVEDLDLNHIVRFHGQVSVEGIVQALQEIDIGLVPNRLSPFTNVNFPTRIFECLIMKKPVIVARTRGVLDYFKEEECYYFEPENIQDLCEKIVHVFENPGEAAGLVKKGRSVLNRHQWANEKKVLVLLVRRLLKKHRYNR